MARLVALLNSIVATTYSLIRIRSGTSSADRTRVNPRTRIVTGGDTFLRARTTARAPIARMQALIRISLRALMLLTLSFILERSPPAAEAKPVGLYDPISLSTRKQ